MLTGARLEELSGERDLSSGLVMSSSKFKPERTGRSRARRLSPVIVAVAVIVFGCFALRTMRALMMLGFVDSAIGRVRVISTAETLFAKAHPDFGYTCTLSQLSRSDDITRLLAQNRIDNGYAFEIIGCQAASPEKPNTTYYVTARPLHAGQPAFCSDQSGVLMSDDGGSVEKCIAKRTPFP
jgi:hypothetical protein